MDIPWQSSEAVTGGVLEKKEFLEILQNSKENTCVRVSFLIKLQTKGLEQSIWKTPVEELT